MLGISILGFIFLLLQPRTMLSSNWLLSTVIIRVTRDLRLESVRRSDQARPAQLLYVGLRRGVGLLCQISVVTGGELAGCNVSLIGMWREKTTFSNYQEGIELKCCVMRSLNNHSSTNQCWFPGRKNRILSQSVSAEFSSWRLT